ncbi:signaling lymphocytic activation molecule-like [Mixophyes fleayi]|uniref:signaling lymphocytic activation molecule-like n=1 Tax=Mixophyes fleayi TaxID=3061075 RepID=UPI003F4DB725
MFTCEKSLLLAQFNLTAGFHSLELKKEQENSRRIILSSNLQTKDKTSNDARYQYEERDSTIYIHELQREDEGVYELTVKFSKDEWFCKIDLKVYEQITNLSVDMTHVFQNDSCVVSMNCVIQTGDDVTFSWTQDQKTLSHDRSILVIEVTPANASSWYTCIAKNPVSERNSTVRFPAKCNPTPVESEEKFDPAYVIYAVIAVLGVIAAACIIKVFRPKIGNFTVHPVSSPKRHTAPEPISEQTHQSVTTIYASVQKREISGNNTTATDVCPISTIYELAGASREYP